MSLAEAFEANREEIARQVLKASERLSLQTTVRFRDNGSMTLAQPGGSVTLTKSQVEELQARIGSAVQS